MAEHLGVAPERFGVFHAILRGSCILSRAGQRPITLAAGDVVVYPRAVDHGLADSPATEMMSIVALLRRGQTHEDIHAQMASGDGPATTMLCGYFSYDRGGVHPLLEDLPSELILQDRRGPTKERIDMTIRFIASEAENVGPGHPVVLTRLTDILFIQVVRSWIANGHGSAGWMKALADEPTRAALAAIHSEPNHAWTVESLSSIAKMSKSAFSRRFHQLVGHPPLGYLTRWRLQLACEDLRSSGMRTLEIAERAGYSSEAAFSRAFRRYVGVTPGQYRSGQGPIDPLKCDMEEPAA